MTSIISIYRRFPTKESCLEHLENVRWEDKPCCPYCKSEKVSRKKEVEQRSRWQCSLCRKSFSVTVGTIFHNSHIDLKKWFVLIGKLNEGPISAAKMASVLRIRRPTASKMMESATQNWASWEVKAVLSKDDSVRWLPVTDWEGFYDVSENGEVYSYRRKKVMSAKPNEDGYPRVLLWKKGSSNHHRFVHTIVLEAFKGPCPFGMEACHNDGNPANNHVDNLRWDTRSANQMDRHEHGTVLNGEKCHLSRLTKPKVQEIRRRLADGEGLSALGRAYGVHATTILAIKEGRSWRHV